MINHSDTHLVVHGALVGAGVAPHGLDDDEQLVVCGEEVPLCGLEAAAVLGPGEARLGAARRQALDHRGVAKRDSLALHRLHEPGNGKKIKGYTHSRRIVASRKEFLCNQFGNTYFCINKNIKILE